jgi:multiple sugar transport system ATP-binding protein
VATITFTQIRKTYPDGTQAVIDLNLAINDGEFMVLVGPSGSGKTTALRMVAGLEEISEGTIEIGGRIVNDVAPRDRDIAMVFQNYAIYPHMSVFDNIGFGLRLRKWKKSAIEQSVRPASQMLGLEDVLEKKPRELSGGQRQRVAMGRAIVRKPQLFLMDEPLSNLDAQLRVQMRAEIRRLQRELGVTTLYVTHDQVEAMTLGDRVAVFRAGSLQQVAEPAELYRNPTNTFVAAFIGSPSMNFLKAELGRHGQTLVAISGSETIELTPDILTGNPSLESHVGKTVVVGIRPEFVRVSDATTNDQGIRGRVELVETLGSEALVHISTAALPAFEAPVHLRLADATQARLIARMEAPRELHLGDDVYVTLDPGNLHFFDLENGNAI